MDIKLIPISKYVEKVLTEDDENKIHLSHMHTNNINIREDYRHINHYSEGRPILFEFKFENAAEQDRFFESIKTL